MKKVLLTLLGLIITLLVVISFRTAVFSSMQKKEKPLKTLDFGQAPIEHLSKAIAIPTISYGQDLPVDSAAFKRYHQFLAETYPLVHSRLRKETFSSFSLLYTWEGTDKTLKPIILMAHMDVVPAVDPATWTYPPFSGKTDESFIWGRGSLDDKASMISILEAVEKLLAEKYQPKRTLYLAFGHDEELSGKRGAKVMASILEKRGIKAKYILDEGMAITQGMVPMINRPVALIGTSEKGQASVTLSVKMEGGHSSTPEKETAISVLSKAMEKTLAIPMKTGIEGSVGDFIRYIGPEMLWYAKILFANSWIFKKTIISIYKKTASGNALVSTTAAPTILRAGEKANVLSTQAEAVINYRILPGETSAVLLGKIKKAISDDRVKLSIDQGASEPTQVSPVRVPGFQTIQKAIRQVYPEAIIAPTLMLASSDSRNYSRISRNIYKFAPLYVNAKDMTRIHGIDERIAKNSFNKAINFYYRLIRNQ